MISVCAINFLSNMFNYSRLNRRQSVHVMYYGCGQQRIQKTSARKCQMYFDFRSDTCFRFILEQPHSSRSTDEKHFKSHKRIDNEIKLRASPRRLYFIV